MEFEKNSQVELNREVKLEEIEQTTDPVSFCMGSVCYVAIVI
jgi:hypothetical protein